MALCEFQWFSQILGRQIATNVLIPEAGQPSFPVLYLLHGLSDNHTQWVRQTRIEAYAAERQIMVVMPDGGRGFYTDQHAGPRWATHIAEELPAIIERTFPARADSAGRFIGGLSMGGYGALRVALGYPGKYASAHSHSGAVMGPRAGSLAPDEYEQIVGGDYSGSSHDLLLLAERAAQQGKLPRLRIDCGTEDFLLDANRAFHQSLQQRHIEHEYLEFPGAHNWLYWDQHIRGALAFHLHVAQAAT